MKNIRYEALFIFFAVCLLGVIPAKAQMSIMVTPIRVEHQVQAGANETNVIEIRNEGAEPSRISVHAEDWTMDRKGTVSFSPAGGDPSSCANWLEINPTDFRLDPGQARQIRYSLTVPAEAKDGGYRAAIALEGMPPPQEGAAKRKMTA